MNEKLQLNEATLLLNNDQITVLINNNTVNYQNTYTAFSFNPDRNQLIAPHFKLTVTPADAERLSNWLMDLFI